MAARDLRGYIGVTEAPIWASMRERITYLIGKHINLSPYALPPTQQSSVEVVVQTVIDEFPQYFTPNRRIGGALLLRGYVVQKSGWDKWKSMTKGRHMVSVGPARRTSRNGRSSKGLGLVSRKSGRHSYPHTHRYPTRGSQTASTNLAVTDDDDQSRAQSTTASPQPVQKHQRLVPFVELPAPIRKVEHEYLEQIDMQVDSDLESLFESPASPEPEEVQEEVEQPQVPAPEPAPEPEPEPIARQSAAPIPIHHLPQDELALFLETQCQRPLQHLYPYLHRYGCETIDDIRLISQWPLAHIKEVLKEVKAIVPISQLQKIRMLDWDYLAFSISRVGKEMDWKPRHY